MQILPAMLGLTVLFAANVYAQDAVGWRDAQGRPVPESDSQKSSKGFGGSLILTPDADWAEKWARPETPQFTTTEVVKLGETVAALVFFVNPGTDQNGQIRILCDFLITRPDGSVSADKQGSVCAQGKLEGDPHRVRLVDQIVGFQGEASDLEGIWTLKVRLTDTVRDASVELKTQFEYSKAGKPRS